MFCPNYKNKEVFDGFNEMVVALGGKPLTEEEFRSSELRNKRTGGDYSAMESAYKLYHRNGGNFLDLTPDGKKSILFKTLLEHFNGDRESAIIAKSNVYSDEFALWFGDWWGPLNVEESEDIKYGPISKVVDLNGEPLVVWHSLDKKEFDDRLANWFSTKRQLYYGNVEFPVYLNIKNIYRNGNPSVEERALVTEYGSGNEYDNLSNLYDGAMVYHSVFDFYEIVTIKNSNQVKHIENLGTWNPNDPNIYKAKITSGIELASLDYGINIQFLASSGEVVFGKNGFDRLISGQLVSSASIIQNVLRRKIISPSNIRISEVVQYHDVPVKFGLLEDDTVAITFYNEKGETFIIVNQNLIGVISNKLLADSMLHEVIHAVTVGAIDNPITKTLSKFAALNSKTYNLFAKALPENEYDRARVDEGYYILQDEKEFAAVFASDPVARLFIYDAAKALDSKKYGKFKRSVANFINSFVLLFTDNIVINTNKALLDKYKRNLIDHLNNVPQIIEGNIKTKDLFNAIYNQSSSVILYNDHVQINMRDAAIMYKGFQQNAAKIKPSVTTDDIAKLLLTRRKMIEQSSSTKDEVLKMSQMLETQAELLLSDAMLEKYTGIVSIINQMIPLVLSDYLYVKGLSVLSADDYMEVVHNNFDSYNKLAKDLQELLNQESFKNDLVHAMGISNDQAKVTEFLTGTYNDMLDQLSKIQSLYNKLEPKLKDLRQNTVVSAFTEVCEAVHDPGGEKWLNDINKTGEDISNFVAKWGAMDSASDNGIRAIYHLVELANKKADRETSDIMVDLLELASKVKKSDLKLLYETLDDGTTSGYLIRDLNFGKFYNAYDKAIQDINQKINERFGTFLAKDNRLPPNEEDARFEWNKLRNDWLSKNCNRKFKNEYYEALGDLPEIARKRLSEINNAIFLINMLPGVIDKAKNGDNYPHYEVLDDETYEQLNNLRTLKKQLYNLYYDNGQKKTGEDLYIAQKLQEYHDKLYGGKDNKKVHFKKDRSAWLTALKKELFICGGQEAVNIFGDENFEALEEYINSSETFNNKRWKKWNERNSKFLFISNGDENGGTLINDQIMREYGNDKPYYGPEEKAISDQIADLMRPYYQSNGFVNDKKMSRALKKELVELLLKQSKLRRKATKNNPALKKEAARYGAIVLKYFKFEKTEAFKEIERLVRDKIHELYGYFNQDAYYRIIQQYGTAWFDRSTGMYTDFKPYKWYTKAVAKNKYKYMEWVPGENFTDIEGSTEFRNPKFDESYGTSYVPLESKYKNENYSKITGDLLELHKKIAEILKNANSKMKNRVYVDNYLLPQITGSMYKRMKAHKTWGDKFHAAKDYILEQFGFGGVPQNDDAQLYGTDYEEKDSEEGSVEITLSEKRKRLGVLKNRPDGHPLRMIPLYYTEKKNPQYISQDIIGITLEYFNMAARFKNKSDIKNKCEIIVDAIENRKYIKDGVEVNGRDTNTYAAARKFLDMNLYDIRREKADFVRKGNYDFLRSAQLLARYTTANNLGANPKVALTGFLTTMWSHLINAISGNGYGFWDAHNAGKEVLWFAAKLACTFGARTIENRLSNDEIVVMAEYYNVANQLQRKYKNQNRNAFVNAIYRNSVFGLLSSVDFLSKSCIMLSVLNSFRFVNGEFLSEDLIYRNAAMLPKDKRLEYINKTLKEYDKAPKLRSFIKVKDHKFTVTDHVNEYNKVDYLVKSRIEKIAERADGMATQAQKAAITLSWIGALILIHRLYLPLMIQERLSNPVYDYDMQMYKNGLFKIFKDFLTATIRGSVLGGVGAGALGGFLIGNIWGAAIGATAGGLYSYKTKNKHDKKSIKEVWDLMTNYTTSDDYDLTLQNMYNKRVLTLVGSEIAIYNLLLDPFITALCKYADKPEEKNSKFLLFICLVARQFQWESYNPYRFTDVFNTVKNVTAATGSGDVMQDIFNGISAEANYAVRLMLPRAGGTVTAPIQTLYDTIENPLTKKGKSGTYLGFPQWFKLGAKAVPWSNTIELVLDSKGKRKWIEGKTMRIEKDDPSLLYDAYEAFQ